MMVGLSPAQAANPVDCYNIAMDGLKQSKVVMDKEAAYNSVLARIKAYIPDMNHYLVKDIHADDAHDWYVASNELLDVLLPSITIRMKQQAQGCVSNDQAKQTAALLDMGNTEAQMVEQVKFTLISAGVK
jgi:hypothetical protein